ncbi:MAG: hypothetical protein ABH846_04540 [Patescibacteria group bacterium]
MKKYILFSGGLMLLIILGAGCLGSTQSPTEITSFEECVAAGNPIMESYPRQCATPDGQSFTEVITDDLVNDQIIGGDTDEHDCLIAAGYSWCEYKQTCIRVWEKICDPAEPIQSPSDLVAKIKAYNNEKSGVGFVSSQAEFEWQLENDTATISGDALTANRVSTAAYEIALDFFDDYGFELDQYNIADGTISGMKGYHKDYFFCQVQHGAAGYQNAPADWVPPEPEILDVEIRCGVLE